MKKLMLATGLALLTLSASSAFAAKNYWGTGVFSKVAIKGYDPVSYFTTGKPTEGNSKYKYCWHCATWYFTNQADLNKFKQDPNKYAPQYGGWCAYAMGIGKFAPGNPKYAEVYNGKLYLNISAKVQKLWQANKDHYIKQGDINWKKFIAEDKLKSCSNTQSCE